VNGAEDCAAVCGDSTHFALSYGGGYCRCLSDLPKDKVDDLICAMACDDLPTAACGTSNGELVYTNERELPPDPTLVVPKEFGYGWEYLGW